MMPNSTSADPSVTKTTSQPTSQATPHASHAVYTAEFVVHIPAATPKAATAAYQTLRAALAAARTAQVPDATLHATFRAPGALGDLPTHPEPHSGVMPATTVWALYVDAPGRDPSLVRLFFTREGVDGFMALYGQTPQDGPDGVAYVDARGRVTHLLDRIEVQP